MYGVSTQLYDLEGAFLINDEIGETKIHDFDRRVNRTKTLDNSVVISDRGYTAGDRTMVVATRDFDKIKFENIKRLFQEHSGFVVCTSEGTYLANAKTFQHNNGLLKLTFWIEGTA